MCQTVNYLSILFKADLMELKSGLSKESSDQHLLINAASSTLHPSMSVWQSSNVGRKWGRIMASFTYRHISANEQKRTTYEYQIPVLKLWERNLVTCTVRARWKSENDFSLTHLAPRIRIRQFVSCFTLGKVYITHLADENDYPLNEAATGYLSMDIYRTGSSGVGSVELGLVMLAGKSVVKSPSSFWRRYFLIQSRSCFLATQIDMTWLGSLERVIFLLAPTAWLLITFFWVRPSPFFISRYRLGSQL
jgi:hypothetical protein